MTEQMTLPMIQNPPRARYPRPTGRHYEGKDNAGKPIIIDSSEIVPNHFEIMAMRPGGDELESKTAFTIHEADAIYKAMVDRLTKPEPAAPMLTGKYAKLRDDLKTALAAGRAAEDADPEDGGTCNLDSSALLLPRWNAAKVEQAASEAGTGCFVWNLCGTKRFVFIPNTKGQGNARSRNAEAMTKALRALGYDAFDYCQID